MLERLNKLGRSGRAFVIISAIWLVGAVFLSAGEAYHNDEGFPKVAYFAYLLLLSAAPVVAGWSIAWVIASGERLRAGRNASFAWLIYVAIFLIPVSTAPDVTLPRYFFVLGLAILGVLPVLIGWGIAWTLAAGRK